MSYQVINHGNQENSQVSTKNQLPEDTRLELLAVLFIIGLLGAVVVERHLAVEYRSGSKILLNFS